MKHSIIKRLEKLPKDIKTKRLLPNKDVYEYGEKQGIFLLAEELEKIEKNAKYDYHLFGIATSYLLKQIKELK